MSRFGELQRIIMLADLDHFYTQVEERRNPSLKGKAVVVCVYSGRTEESGVVATANYAARKYGVKSGIPIALAKKRLKDVDAIFLPMDHDYYKGVSDSIMSELRVNADNFEQVGIDEAYLDVSQSAGGFAEAETLARRIKEQIKEKESLTISIGIGPNKLIAKIASDINKPDGLMVVRPENAKEFLSPLPVDKIPGIGKKTMEKLDQLGIKTIGELASYDMQKLDDIFGLTMAIYFHKAASGIDEGVVREGDGQESISRIATLKENTRDLKKILETTERLCEEVQGRVVQSGLYFKSIGIVVITKDLYIRTRSKSISTPTDDIGMLKRTTKELFQKFLEESRLEIRRAGVHVSNFVKKEKGQSQLTGFI